MQQEGFSTPQICDLTGIPYGTLYHWLSTDFITPSLAKPQGRGKPARWTFQDVVAIQTAQALRQHGISLQGLRKVVSYIQTHFDVEQPLSERWLATDGHEVYLLDGDALRPYPMRTHLFHLVDMPDDCGPRHPPAANATPYKPSGHARTQRRCNYAG
jgi:hypothetical protein